MPPPRVCRQPACASSTVMAKTTTPTAPKPAATRNGIVGDTRDARSQRRFGEVDDERLPRRLTDLTQTADHERQQEPGEGRRRRNSENGNRAKAMNVAITNGFFPVRAAIRAAGT